MAPKRRGRHLVSCAECRRMKLKCDRSVPCGNCSKRGCADICPSGTRSKASKSVGAPPNAHLEQRVRLLENLLRERDVDIDQVPELYQANGPSPNSLHRDEDSIAAAGPQRLDEGSTSGAQPHPPRVRPSLGSGTELGVVDASAGDPSRQNTFSNGFPEAPNMDLDHSPTYQPGPSVHFSATISPPGPTESLPSQELAVAHNADEEGAECGTLVVGDAGRSRYLGTRAGVEWLRNQEAPGFSRAASEDITENASPELVSNFPFGPRPVPLSSAELFEKIPCREETHILVESYFRLYAWNMNPIPRTSFNAIFDRAYDTQDQSPIHSRLHIHQLAVLYAVFAMGAHHCLEYPPNDPIVDEYLKLAKCCLSGGDFLATNTIPGLQALFLIGHVQSETERGRKGDVSWPIWGMAMRLIQAMGVHRDGTQWKLQQHVTEERRVVFWECYFTDVFQAHCFSRPPSMCADHFDTHFPSISTLVSGVGRDLEKEKKSEGNDFKIAKYELAKVLAKSLHLVMNTKAPAYEKIVDLYRELCDFERSIPFHLRCRTALIATPSRYPHAEAAIKDSPPVNRRDLKRTFEQFTLALNVSEAMLFLQRTYYVKAMNEKPSDPVLSRYGASFLTVIERCNIVTQIVCGLADLHPGVASRHWFYWYHLFTAAACVGILVLRCPRNPMVSFAMSILDNAISAYAIAVRQNASPTLKLNHEWLLRLRQRDYDRISQATHGTSPNFSMASSNAEGSDRVEENIDQQELLGWRTRLIERAGQGQDRIATAGSPAGPNQSQKDLEGVGATRNLPDGRTAPLSMPRVDAQTLSADMVLQQHFVLPGDENDKTFGQCDTTSNLMDPFLDPVAFQFYGEDMII